MNQIIGIILFKDNEVTNKYIDVSWVNFFVRSSVIDGIVNNSREIVNRIRDNDTGKVVCVNFDTLSSEVPFLSDVVCYCYADTSGYASTIMTKNYKHGRVIVELTQKLHSSPWENLEDITKQYEDPASIDKIAKLQDELDKTIEIMHINIGKVFERGENIKVLEQKTHELSISTKIFVDDARKLNSCCAIL